MVKKMPRMRVGKRQVGSPGFAPFEKTIFYVKWTKSRSKMISTGLRGTVPYYEYALDLILDIENPNEQHLTQMQQDKSPPRIS
ncbi:unnamed protein product [Albugo candida]|uniref:Uncharacterized protein n=1 Tax=Albugo candida TaxID=65357 RepID=A0A024GG42_9STRA|nr:unnamed protein product [Albugo candida]|eukprot:CCI45733.1 unnamed protein product [Albugo candida]